MTKKYWAGAKLLEGTEWLQGNTQFALYFIFFNFKTRYKIILFVNQ